MLTLRSYGGTDETSCPSSSTCPSSGRVEPGDQPQAGGLARARRPEHREELAGLDRRDETPSTARTVPKMRETPRNSIAAVMSGRRSALFAADDRDVVRDPAAVRARTCPATRTSASGVRQNLILSKFSMPLVLQPSAPSSSLFSQAAGTAGTEPNHAATSPCTFGVMRPLHPLVGAVRMLGLRVQHGGVGPTGGAFGRHGARDRLLVRDQRVHLERPRARGDDAFVR